MLPYQGGTVMVTSPFGWRTLNGEREYHKGIDLVGTNKNIVAVEGGVVGVSTIFEQATDTTLTWQWGNYVRIDTDSGLKMYYCHMSKRIAVVGQRVKAGDILGVEGNTGYSLGSHCHFEVRNNAGVSLDPSPYLGIPNAVGSYPVQVTPDYAALVCGKCGLEEQTKAYLNEYTYASDLWRKLWEAMQ